MAEPWNPDNIQNPWPEGTPAWQIVEDWLKDRERRWRREERRKRAQQQYQRDLQEWRENEGIREVPYSRYNTSTGMWERGTRREKYAEPRNPNEQKPWTSLERRIFWENGIDPDSVPPNDANRDMMAPIVKIYEDAERERARLWRENEAPFLKSLRDAGYAMNVRYTVRDLLSGKSKEQVRRDHSEEEWALIDHLIATYQQQQEQKNNPQPTGLSDQEAFDRAFGRIDWRNYRGPGDYDLLPGLTPVDVSQGLVDPATLGSVTPQAEMAQYAQILPGMGTNINPRPPLTPIAPGSGSNNPNAYAMGQAATPIDPNLLAVNEPGHSIGLPMPQIEDPRMSDVMREYLQFLNQFRS